MFSYSAASQQANADMAEEQQVQTEGEDLEAQDGMLKMDLQ